VRKHIHNDCASNPCVRGKPMDSRMAEEQGRDGDQEPSEDYVVRLIAEAGGHTWVYAYPPEESGLMINVITEHAIRRKLPVEVADVLVDMVIGGDDASL
jgi:hypothetical protein